jgi:FkbM family methyltransferase
MSSYPRLRSVFRRVGLDVVRYPHGPHGPGSLRDGLARLSRAGIRPATLIDVGVGDGTPELYSPWPDASLLLVEPVAEMEPFLQSILSARHGSYVIAAAGADSGRRSMHVALDSPLHSGFYRYDEPSANWVDREVPVATLDDLVTESGLTGPYLLKLDIQGGEIDALRGAARLLKETCCVVSEATVVPSRGYDAPLIGDLVAYMTESGFSMFDIVGGHRWETHDLFQADVAFVPTPFVVSRRGAP